jgi:pantetheine-phosphate adenylyltransferase
MNRRLSERIETVFMMPRGKYIYLSSSLVKEVAGLGGEVAAFVPGPVERALRKKLQAKRG